MSLLKIKKTIVFAVFGVLIAGLSACGYQPLHGQRQTTQNTAITDELSRVWIYEIEDREGQILHNELLSLFNPKGRPRSPNYKLKVSYVENSSGLGIGKNDFATRANFTVTANFNLSGVQDLKGTSTSVVSYNILTSPTGTEFAKRDARERAIKSVAADIHRRIAVHILNVKTLSKDEN